MNEITENNVNALLNAGAALNDPITVHGGIPYVTLPDGYAVHDLERLGDIPSRKRATVSVTNVSSFVGYVVKHGDTESCVVYAAINGQASRCELTAVLNDHETADPGWRDHRCIFDPEKSVEWVRWMSKNKVQMNQADFAAWLEDNLGDIANVQGMPTGAQMLTMALAFEATAEKRLKSRINLQSGGVRFEYVEDEDKDTRTSMDVFQRFTLGLPVFEGSSDAYPVEARLKYRETGGKVLFWYEPIRPDKAFKTAVQSTLDLIAQETSFTILHGTP